MTYKPPEGRPPSRPPGPDWAGAANAGWITPTQPGWVTPEQRRNEVRQLMAEKDEPIITQLKPDSPEMVKLKRQLEEALKGEKQRRVTRPEHLWTPDARDKWHTSFVGTINKRRRRARALCDKMNAEDASATWMVLKDAAKLFDMTTSGARQKAHNEGWKTQSYSKTRLLMVRVPSGALPKTFAHKEITRPAPIIPQIPKIELPDRTWLVDTSPERPSLWRRFINWWCIR